MYLVSVKRIKGYNVSPYILKLNRRRSLIPINISIGRVEYSSTKIKREDMRKYKMYKMITIKFFKDIDDVAHHG